MTHLLLISAVVIVLVRDGIGGPPLRGLWGPWETASVVLGAMAGAWLTAHLWIMRQSRVLDRTGRVGAAASADRALLVSRFVMLAAFGAGVLLFGWLDVVRSVVGDVVALDEWTALAPFMILFALGWWSIYPVDQRMRDAVLQRNLDEGEPVYPPLSRRQFVWSGVRHQMGLILAPVLLITAWAEFVQRATVRLVAAGGVGGLRGAALDLVGAAVQVTGVVIIFAVMPVVLSRLWDTVPLGPGPVRDRLMDLCRAQRVKVRNFLVWRTQGSMVNGAVMGLVGPLRYVLLTDALLDFLTGPQVEAVAAHEVGHVRRRHMIWLAVASVAAIMGTAIVLGRAAEAAFGTARLQQGHEGGWIMAGVTLAALAAGAVVFGFASRRFEWQADAFAVQHLSGHRVGGRSAVPVVVSREAVDAMVGALDTVARLNNIPLRKFTWRHGSIATRRRKLLAAVGARADRLGADAGAAAVKLLSACAAAAVGVLMVLEVVRAARGGPV